MLKRIKCKKIKERDNRRDKNYRRDKIPKGQKKEGEEKNSSSTQAKWGRREKSSLTTQENFWCVKLWRMRALFIGSKVDEKWKIGLMHFDGDLNEIDGFEMWFEWFFKRESWRVKMAWLVAHLRKEEKKKNWTLRLYFLTIFGLIKKS